MRPFLLWWFWISNTDTGLSSMEVDSVNSVLNIPEASMLHCLNLMTPMTTNDSLVDDFEPATFFPDEIKVPFGFCEQMKRASSFQLILRRRNIHRVAFIVFNGSTDWNFKFNSHSTRSLDGYLVKKVPIQFQLLEFICRKRYLNDISDYSRASFEVVSEFELINSSSCMSMDRSICNFQLCRLSEAKLIFHEFSNLSSMT